MARATYGLIGTLIGVIPSIGYGIEWAGWELHPAFSLGGEAGVNPILLFDVAGERIEGKVGGVGTVSSGLLLSRHKERWEVDLGARLIYEIFEVPVDIPTMETMRVDLHSLWRATERSLLHFDGAFKRDNMLRRVFPQRGFDPDLEDVDIAFALDLRRRHRIQLAPLWEYELTERAGVQLGYIFLDISFPNGEQPVDTQQQLVSGGGSYKLTPRSSLNLGLNASRITSERIEADNVEFMAGINHALTETLDGEISAGYRITSIDSIGEEESSSGFVGNLQVQYNTELNQLRGDIGRRLSPSILGRPVQSDRLVLLYSRAIRPRWNFSLRVDVIDAEAVEERRDIGARYIEVMPRLSWSWTRWWAIEGGPFYRRRTLDREEISATAQGYGAFVAVTYTPPQEK